MECVISWKVVHYVWWSRSTAAARRPANWRARWNQSVWSPASHTIFLWITDKGFARLEASERLGAARVPARLLHHCRDAEPRHWKSLAPARWPQRVGQAPYVR